MRDISWLAEDLSASQEGLISVELVALAICSYCTCFKIFIYLFIHLSFIYLFIHSFIYFICLFIYLFIYTVTLIVTVCLKGTSWRRKGGVGVNYRVNQTSCYEAMFRISRLDCPPELDSLYGLHSVPAGPRATLDDVFRRNVYCRPAQFE